MNQIYFVCLNLVGGRREIGKRRKIGECVKCEECKIGSESIAGTDKYYYKHLESILVLR